MNGVNVIGLSLQGPSVPLAVIRSPTAAAQQAHSAPAAVTVATTNTTGIGTGVFVSPFVASAGDLMLPLQPKLLLPTGNIEGLSFYH